jgi:23S rRNA pseudouridine2605 synthase
MATGDHDNQGESGWNHGRRSDNSGRRGEKDASGRERLQRVLADAGVAARRVCEAMIEAGRVRVNGQIVRKLPVFVVETDEIEVDSRRIPPRGRPVYVLVNKPERTLVTSADEPGIGRTTVMDLVKHPSGVRLFPVGRMDYYSTGLVLLTNDGELANRLTHPRYGVPRTYEITVRGTVTAEHLRAIRAKIRVAKERIASDRPGKAKKSQGSQPEIETALDVGDRSMIRLTLRESGTPDLREMLREIGIPVKRMTRIAYGPLNLAGLAIGRWRELERQEIQAIKKGQPLSSGQGGGTGGDRKMNSYRKPRPEGADGQDVAKGGGQRASRVTRDQIRAIKSGAMDASEVGPTADGSAPNLSRRDMARKSGWGGEKSGSNPKKMGGAIKFGPRTPKTRAEALRKVEDARTQQQASKSEVDGTWQGQGGGGGGGRGGEVKPRRLDWNGSNGGGKPR